MEKNENDYSWLWKMLLGAAVNVAVQKFVRKKAQNNSQIIATAGIGALAGLAEDLVSENINDGYGFLSGLSAGSTAGAVLGIGNAIVNNDDILAESLKFAGGIAAIDGSLRGLSKPISKRKSVNKYSFMTVNLCIVSVNGSKLPDAERLKQYLNRIYYPAFVQFEITSDKIDGVGFAGHSFAHGKSGLFSVYNKDQKAILHAFDKKIVEGHIYLFFVGDMAGNQEVKGYMPLCCQCGFIYGNAEYRTVAHEVGHSLGLRHNAIDNENLMSYSFGINVSASQTQTIHRHKRKIIKWWQKEVSGQNVSSNAVIFDNVSDYDTKKIVVDSISHFIPFVGGSNTNNSECIFFYREFNKDYYEDQKDFLQKNPLFNPEIDSSAWDRVEAEAKEFLLPITDTYHINSPMTYASISQDGSKIVDFYTSDLVFLDIWRKNYWPPSSSQKTVSKVQKRNFANASLKGGELDLAKSYKLNSGVLYRVKTDDGNETLYNANEIRYWAYGYLLSTMNFSHSEAVFAAMQFFDKRNIDGTPNVRTYELPWLIKAMSEGFCSHRTQGSHFTPINVCMYQPYYFNMGRVIDTDWDLSDFAIDMILSIGTFGVLKVGKSAVQIGTKISVGALIDIILQIGLAKLDGSTTEEAVSNVVWSDAIYSGVETLHKRWVNASLMSALRIAMKEIPYIRNSDDVIAIHVKCGESLIANLLAHRLIGANDRFAKIIRKCLHNNASETINGLWALGCDKDLVEWIVARVLTAAEAKYRSYVIELIQKIYANE